MTTALPVLAPCLAILALWSGSFLVGRAILHRLGSVDRLEALALSSALGLGVLSHVFLGLGLLRAFSAGAVVATVVVLSGGAVAFLRRKAVTFLPEETEPRRGETNSGTALPRPVLLGLAACGVAAFLPYLVLPLYPPTAFDATMYHLPAAREFVRQQALVVLSDLRFPVYTLGVHMLDAALLHVAPDTATNFLRLLSTAIVALLLVAWGRALGGWRVGAVAGALWLSSPVVLHLSSAAYLDAPLALFVTGAVYCVWRSGEREDAGWAALGGAFAGFACGVKYTALYAVAILGVAVVVRALRRKAWRSLWAFSVLAFVTGAPWYLRNAFYTGNPTWPFLGGLFGVAPYWSQADLAGVLGDLATPGLGRGPGALLLLPWNLALHADRFYTTPFGGFSLAVFLALPLAVLGAATVAGGVFLGVFVSAFVGSWFYGSQVLRYLLPALPAFTVLAALGCRRVLEARALTRRPALAMGLDLAVVLVLLGPASFEGWRSLGRLGPPPLSPPERAAYLDRSIPDSAAMRWVALRPGTVYSLFGANAAYFAPGRFLGDWVGPYRYREVVHAMRRGGEALHSQLRAWDCRYLHVSKNRLLAASHAALPDDEGFRRRFRPVAMTGAWELYELVDDAGPPPETTGCVANAGFEELNGAGVAVGWSTFGTPLFDASGREARTGRVAARVDQANTVFQYFRVDAGRRYVLRESFRASLQAGSRARLQVNWVDRDGTRIGSHLELVDAGPAWTSRATIAVAPPGAVGAVVFGACHEACGEGIWIDDLSVSALSGEAAPVQTGPS